MRGRRRSTGSSRSGGFDLILSIGQVVPHEVIGMANYNKNILVGTGGREGINRSHYLGAVYGMERIMGRAVNPVRNVLNYASDHFLRHLPIVYVLTVIGRKADGDLGGARPLHRRRYRVLSRGRRAEPEGQLRDRSTSRSRRPSSISIPSEFHSTWLGNKAIYRTRMALADGAELIILAPGVKEFGEDKAHRRTDPQVRLSWHPGNA